MDIVAFKVSAEYQSIAGKSVGELALRPDYGITILAVLRDDRYITQFSTDYVIQTNDVLYVFGKHSNIADFSNIMLRKK